MAEAWSLGQGLMPVVVIWTEVFKPNTVYEAIEVALKK
jgi:hypothetical protein